MDDLEYQSLLSVTPISHVFLCREKKTREHIVVKSMPREFEFKNRTEKNTSVGSEVWANEVLLQAGGHPNLVLMTGIMETEDRVHLFFEYCNQGDLYSIIQHYPNTRLNEEVALQAFADIVSALVFMGECGISHRDIALENVFVHNGRCMLADFGLSVPIYESFNESIGRKYYAAPEVAAGMSYSPSEADVWALGIMLFIMITGSPVGEVANENDVGFRVVRQFGVNAMIHAWKMDHLVSDDTIDLISSMLKWNPYERMKLQDILKHTTFCKFFAA